MRADETFETPEEVYADVAERYSIDDRNDLETFLDAVEQSTTVFEITREVREPRTVIKTALNKLGLSAVRDTFPPADLDDRLETLREGELPEAL